MVIPIVFKRGQAFDQPSARPEAPRNIGDEAQSLTTEMVAQSETDFRIRSKRMNTRSVTLTEPRIYKPRWQTKGRSVEQLA
jgi:hypothetical protein